MKVLLPSKGLFGQRSVDLRFPTFKDLKEIQNYSDSEIAKKIKFITQLSNVNLSKVSFYDAEYLFAITAFSLLYNNITYNITCPKCKERFKTHLQIFDLEIKQLDRRKEEQVVDGKKYQFNVLSAQQVLDAYEQSQFEDNVEEANEDMLATMTLGLPIQHHKSIAGTVPLRVYASTFVFQRLKFHGLSYLAKAKCNCGNEVTYKYNIGSEVLSLSIEDLMDKYYDVSSWMSLEDFWSMTLPDYNAFVQVVNRKNMQ